MITRADVTAMAHSYGFVDVRFARVGEPPHLAAFDDWIARGFAADMAYLERDRAVRANPRLAFPPARTAMVLSFPFAHRRPARPDGLVGRVASYAWGRDYHNLVGKRVRKLRSQLREVGCSSWGSIDTSPTLERSWAEAAGLGATGKNALRLVQGSGSWFFLAVVFLGVELEPDVAIERDPCGSCSRCLTACPTRAFVAPRVVDGRRCISYWTIEAAGLAPAELRPAFGDWLFGCDDCQTVCPHNGRAPTDHHPDLGPAHAWVDLPELIAQPDAVVNERFRGTPLLRAAARGLKRNAAIVLGNSGDDRAVPALREVLAHPEPVVRGAAVWALARLGAPPLAHRDTDPLVIAELATIH